MDIEESKGRDCCAVCGADFDSEASGGLCPRCLLANALFEDPQTQLVGTQVSHYEILEKLGAGSMGVVYAARDVRLGRPVAIKFLPDGLLLDPRARRRFEREARAASHLNHPHICAVYDVGEFEDRPFIVMELSTGSSLREMLGGNPLSGFDLVSICLQITEGLETAHQHQILHRDLKPANIFITTEGRAKILDFGLARELRPAEDTVGETSPSVEVQLAGTLPYMAPELFENQPPDPRSDLFSLGVLFYEMATGRCPFQRQTSQATVAAVLTDQPPPPEELNPDLVHGLGRVIQRLLEKDPEKRYADCSAVRADLQQVGAPGATVERRAWAGVTARWFLLIPLLLLAMFLWNYLRPEPATIQSIAVLPFENLSGDPDQEYLADAMTDALIASLAQIRSLRIPSRTTMMRYKDSGKDVPRIGRELHVDAVVEGSVQRSGDEVLVRTRLVNAKTEATLLSRQLEEPFEDLVALQNDVALALVSGVRVNLSPTEEERFVRARPVDPRSYEAYLRGLYLLNKRENLQRAVDYFEEAVRIEPSNALAHAQLAHAYLMLSAYAGEPPRRMAALAGDAASTALRHNPKLPEALVALAAVRMHLDWNWKEAEELYRRTLEIAPSYALAHHWFGLFLAARGDLDGALAQVRTARELEPDSPLVGSALGRIHYYRREYGQAQRLLGGALELEPRLMPAHLARGLVFLQLKEPDRAVSDFREGLRAWPESGPLLDALERVLRDPRGRSGRLERVDPTHGARDVPPFSLAVLAAIIGDSASTLDYLDLAARDRSEYVQFLNVDPLFDFLHDEPRFESLEREMGLAE